ncbi:MAG TPA: glycosyltransferase family 4 protein [Candidatus Saccharimonadales bacterium]|nr:glycosyltransferase family 4 protein [Candidatus Saccharimonadales bacterium]
MKLVLIQPYISLKGGFERVMLEIARHYDAPVYTLEYNPKTTFPEFKDVDIRVIGKDVPFSEVLPYRASQGLKYGYNFYNMKIKDDYDVLNAHISPSEWIRHKNPRVLWYCHTPPREVYDLYEARMKYRSYKEKFLYSAMTKTYKLLSGRIVKKIEFIAANSTNTQKRIQKYYSRESTVINPGIDYEKFSNEGDERYFFYPSRIIPTKRQDYVINAFKKFQKLSKKNYRLVLSGTLSKDPEHAAYYEKLKKLASGSDISIKTNIGDRELAALYSKSTAVLFAAINEDYGYIPLEGMASSKPVISVNEGGPIETLRDGETGFLVNSYSEMANKMAYLTEHKAEAEKMGKRGRQRVISNYSWNAFFKKFDRALGEVSKE